MLHKLNLHRGCEVQRHDAQARHVLDLQVVGGKAGRERELVYKKLDALKIFLT